MKEWKDNAAPDTTTKNNGKGFIFCIHNQSLQTKDLGVLNKCLFI